MRGERGQVSAEWMGALFVVALVIGAFVASGMAGDIATGMKDAICRITGGECGEQTASTDPEKCTVSQSTTSSSADVFVAFVEVGKKSTLIKEVFSDGSVQYTLIDNSSAAGKLFAGGKANIGKYGANLSAEASAGGELDGAQVFEFPDEKSAKEFEDKVKAAGGFDGIIRDLADYNDSILGIPNPLGGVDDWVLDQVGVDDDKDLGTPSAEYVSGQLFIEGKGKAAAGVGGIDGELAAAIKGAGGVKTYTSGPKKGQSEVYIKLNGDANGQLMASLFGVGGGIAGDVEGVVTLKLDENFKPTEFSVKSSAGYNGSLDLNGELKVTDPEKVGKVFAEAAVTGSEGSGQKLEFEGTLDMNDPENAAAVLSLLNPRPGGLAQGAIAVGQRLDEDGKLTLDTSSTSESEAGGSVKVGVGVGGGGGISSSQKDETRTAGLERPPGGTWGPRVCKS